MNKKERAYWDSIAKGQNEPLKRSGRLRDYLAFLDHAVQFVRELKGKLTHEEPTEIELIKRWMRIKRLHGPSH